MSDVSILRKKPHLIYRALNYDNQIRIFKGDHFKKLSNQKYVKAIVLDLDETLGSFSDFSILWAGLEQLSKNTTLPFELSQTTFNTILDLYPEYFRTNIFHIFRYLIKKKASNKCYKVYLYTNNSYSPQFPTMISQYINYKLNNVMFDKLICAFKINGKIIEPLRTTNDKIYTDLIRCTAVPKHSEICFIDNEEYNGMKHDKIYYIQPMNYYHNITLHTMIGRFIHSHILCSPNIAEGNVDTTDHQFIQSFLNQVIDVNISNSMHFSGINTAIEKQVTRKIMYHIREFFLWNTRKPKTKKITYNLGRTTHRKRQQIY